MSSRSRQLDPVEVRVLGALLEKEQATPEAYPLTVNAVIAACNQKTNRDPVTQLTETQVVEALDRLRQEVLVWRVESARAERWEQRVSRRWGLDPRAKALLTLLLLRGPQTVGELHTRSERLHAFPSLGEVEAALRRLSGEAEPLVRELPRRPGQKENRWTHTVGESFAPTETEPEEAAASEAPRGPSLSARVEQLEQTVARLEAELAELRELKELLR